MGKINYVANEMTIYDLVDGIKLKETYENGKLYISNKTNPPYEVYIPNEINSSTQVHAYMHGHADYASQVQDAIKPIRSYLSDNDNNSVVIMYTGVSTVYKGEKAKALLDVTYDCVNAVGASTKNITFEGFSDGGVTAFSLAAEHFKKNPDLPPQLVVSYDASAFDYVITKNLQAGLSDEDIDAYLENGATILTFEKGQHWDASDKPIKYLTSKGIDVVSVLTGQNHEGVNRKTHLDGVYEFLDGESFTLRNKDDYTFQRWVLNPSAVDYEDGEWVDLTEVEVTSLISKNMLSLFMSRWSFLSELELFSPVAFQTGAVIDDSVIESDKNAVIEYANNVKSLIKETSLFDGTYNISAFESTTKMPSEIVIYMNDALNITGLALSKLNDAMDSLVNIGKIFEEVDKYLDNRVDELIGGNDGAINQDNGLSVVNSIVNDSEKDDYSDLTSEDDYDLVDI